MLHDPTEFETWTEYFGPLAATHDVTDNGDRRTSTIYGFENFTDPAGMFATIDAPTGSVVGFVTAGEARLFDRDSDSEGTPFRQGRWFAVPAPVSFELSRFTRVFAVHVAEYRCLRTFGGPVEAAGRLEYIDGCSDTVLMPPALLGDPCFNLLHFPLDVTQTKHTHPSVRCGAVVRGQGHCESVGHGRKELSPGAIWMIPRDFAHSFHTTDQRLQIVAYHPDSNLGPTHGEHPMLARTLVEGVVAQSQPAVELESGYTGPLADAPTV